MEKIDLKLERIWEDDLVITILTVLTCRTELGFPAHDGMGLSVSYWGDRHRRISGGF